MSASVSPSLTEPSATSSVDANSALSALLHRQQQAHLAHMQISVNERRERLQQVIALLVEGHQSLAAAMEADFDGRSKGFSLMNDVLGSMASLKHVRDNLIHWVPEQSRTPFAPYDQLGADAKVIYQPKGVVGIMGTWNAPVFTLLSPLACVLGAGNRAILKPSELAPRTAETLAELFARFVDPALVAVINGDARVGAQFAAQPFDHLVFTGSTAVGRKVMAAASANLTPSRWNWAASRRQLLVAKGIWMSIVAVWFWPRRPMAGNYVSAQTFFMFLRITSRRLSIAFATISGNIILLSPVILIMSRLSINITMSVFVA